MSQLDTATDRPLRFAVLLNLCALGALVVALVQRSGAARIEPSHAANFNFVRIKVTDLIVNLAGFATMLFVP